MSTRIETLTSKTVVVTSKTLDCLTIDDRIVIYRLTTRTTSGRRKPKVTVTEGITSPEGVSAFRDGAVAVPSYKSGQAAVLGTPELVEAMRTHGWLINEFSSTLRKGMSDPYTRWMNGEGRVEDIIIFEGGAHMCHDWQGVPMSCAIAFDYISARMNNGVYDLNKALAILKGRKDIRFWNAGIGEKDGEVLRIPGYNQSRGKTEYLSFVWMPSREDYLKMWARALTYGNKTHASCERYRAIFEEDLLGLRAGGACLVNDFYGSVGDVDESEDSDYPEDD